MHYQAAENRGATMTYRSALIDQYANEEKINLWAQSAGLDDA